MARCNKTLARSNRQNVILKLENVRRLCERLRYHLETFCHGLRAMKHSNGDHMKRLFSSITWKIVLYLV